jgi:hydrogenase maturation protease
MSHTAHPHTLIAGIGNIFLGDDGFGPAVICALAQQPLPAGTRAVDFGIRGLDLAYALVDPYETVILVDAISRNQPPGTVSILEPVHPQAPESIALDPHSMDPVRLLSMARSLGNITARIFIVGCEPLDFGDELMGRMDLSPVVAASIPEAVRAVRDIIHRTHPPAMLHDPASRRIAATA